MSLVVDQIKKMNPQDAIDILPLTKKSSSLPLKKVIASAVANAKNNLGLDPKSLKFESILVSQGPVFKRFQPISRGRAHSILKRTSHIKVTLVGEQKKEGSKVTNVSKAPKEEKTDGSKS